MKTRNIIQIIIFSFLVVSCGQPNPNPIDLSKVDSILIYYNLADDTISLPPRKLSPTSKIQFADDWNEQYPADHCVYYANYLLIVYQNDNTQRQFRAYGQNIKEKTDECFYLNDPEYFDKLWEKGK